MRSRHVMAGQMALVQRAKQLAKWVKGDLRYRGPTETDDFTSLALAKLVKRTTYHEALKAEPERLMGLLRRVLRHVILDRIRYERALCRCSVEPPTGTPRPTPTPKFHSDLGRHERVLAVRAALARAASDDGPHSLGPAHRRARMLQAFELRWQGQSHQEIADALQVAKATVGNWLDLVKAYVRRDLKRQRFDLLSSTT